MNKTMKDDCGDKVRIETEDYDGVAAFVSSITTTGFP